MFNEAAEEAIEQKDDFALTFVLTQCEPSNTQLINKINMFKASLRK